MVNKILLALIIIFIAAFLAFVFSDTGEKRAPGTAELLNVSYDPTRELYEDYNKLFEKRWREETGKDIRVKQSHGGSGKQARSVIDGLNADIVTLALAYDIDTLSSYGHLLPSTWQESYENNSCPYTSTIVFLVRKGNPKNIKDWDDLVRKGIEVITPNPKTSGGARWNYMAAWGYAHELNKGDEAKTRAYIRQLFMNVPLLDTGARGATTTFAQRNIGDVLLAWENEAYLAIKELPGKFDIVYPSISVLAEPPVAIVEKNAARNRNLKASREYLDYLYSPEAQELIVKHYYRPADPKIAEKYADKFPPMKMFKVSDFGGWAEYQKKHFDDGGVFDQIYGKENQ